MARALLLMMALAGCGDICPGRLKCTDNTCCDQGLPYACGGKCYATPQACTALGGYKFCSPEHSDGGAPTGGLQATCQQAGLLYCASPTIPNGEQCCPIIVGSPAAAVGYLCSWGANMPTHGCFESQTLASDPMQGCILYNMGPPQGIVRCTR